jgi:hypothetical protein
MVHACVCCRLRFATNGELADHVRAEHSERRPFEEGHVAVERRRWPAAQTRRVRRPAETSR